MCAPLGLAGKLGGLNSGGPLSMGLLGQAFGGGKDKSKPKAPGGFLTSLTKPKAAA
jgi:hypothetical protein